METCYGRNTHTGLPWSEIHLPDSWLVSTHEGVSLSHPHPMHKPRVTSSLQSTMPGADICLSIRGKRMRAQFMALDGFH